MHTLERRTIEVLPRRMSNGAVAWTKVHCRHTMGSESRHVGPTQFGKNLCTAARNKRCKQRVIQAWRCGIGNVEHFDNIAFFKKWCEQFANMSFCIIR